MDANKRYVTQLSKQDMKELAAVTNMTVGEGLSLLKSGEGWRLELDETAILQMMSRIGVVIGGAAFDNF